MVKDSSFMIHYKTLCRHYQELIHKDGHQQEVPSWCLLERDAGIYIVDETEREMRQIHDKTEIKKNKFKVIHILNPLVIQTSRANACMTFVAIPSPAAPNPTANGVGMRKMAKMC